MTAVRSQLYREATLSLCLPLWGEVAPQGPERVGEVFIHPSFFSFLALFGHGVDVGVASVEHLRCHGGHAVVGVNGVDGTEREQ